ncbi:MAG: hypothetical protein OXF84_07440 [Bacteroidetes bacterium]|nr:hypothetical protein [Bacteroidota bacterium]
MKLTFESHLEYQLNAIKSITDLFSSQVPQNTTIYQNVNEPGFLHSMLAVGNHLILTDKQLLESVNAIQSRNGLLVSDQLDGMHFFVEMETGNGKTYVYLRTFKKTEAPSFDHS